MKRSSLLLVVLASRAASADAPVDAPTAWVGVGTHVSLFAARLDRSNVNVRFGYDLAAGARWGRFGLQAKLEHDLWMQTELDLKISQGALNAAVGGEYLYAHDRVRFSVALGMSVLLEDDVLGRAPSFGVYGELRPTGLRWSRGSWWTVQIDPVGLAIMAPVLRSPRLFEIQHRISMTLEWQSPSGRRALGEH